MENHNLSMENSTIAMLVYQRVMDYGIHGFFHPTSHETYCQGAQSPNENATPARKAPFRKMLGKCLQLSPTSAIWPRKIFAISWQYN